MKKKILLCLICGIILLGVTGCKDESNNTKQAEKENTENETVVDSTNDNNYIEINGYTLSYGNYNSSIEEAVFTLNEDNTFIFTGVYYFDINTKTTINGTYEVTTHSIKDGVTGNSITENVIIFTYEDKTEMFTINENNSFKTQEDSFIYQGE